jgi:hypothetical protein
MIISFIVSVILMTWTISFLTERVREWNGKRRKAKTIKALLLLTFVGAGYGLWWLFKFSVIAWLIRIGVLNENMIPQSTFEWILFSGAVLTTSVLLFIFRKRVLQAGGLILGLFVNFIIQNPLILLAFVVIVVRFFLRL